MYYRKFIFSILQDQFTMQIQYFVLFDGIVTRY